MEKTKVLFLAANPIRENLVALDEEIRAINRRIRASEYRDSLELISTQAVRQDDLQEELLRHRPHIVHFSGHGNKKGEIILVGRNGRPKAVTLKAIEDLFRILQDNIKAVVLNSCFSAKQAGLLTKVIDCAVGMDSTVSDKGAIAFAASFYRAIGYGRSIQTAFELGRHTVEVEGFAGKDAPELKLKDGINANQIIFAGPEAAPLGSESTVAGQSRAVADCAVNVYLTTIKDQKFDLSPDYVVDWRHHFTALGGNTKGHQVKKAADWNVTMLPELYEFERRINEETHCRLIRVRGLARLSAWFAFGNVFSSVNRYTIEVDQWGKLWRTDAKPNRDFKVLIHRKNRWPVEEVFNGRGGTVAVGISVKGSLADDVREHLRERKDKIAACLHLRPERDLADDCLRDAGDVVALAVQVHRLIRDFVRKWSAKRVLLFYYGSLSGACFIGHRLTAIGCREIQIMEDLQPGYAPSFLLRG